ncbi:MAG: trehalose-phosphatase [Pseudomonadota bacterium]
MTAPTTTLISAGLELLHAGPQPASSLPRITAQTALFLDFDGTLVDIAEQPGLVQVSPDLPNLLAELHTALGGALAIVSGRKLSDLDHFLAPQRLPVSAEHGAQFRLGDGSLSQAASPDLHEVSRVALALAAQHAGLEVELKTTAVSLHYRQAPQLEAICLEAMAEAVKRSPGLELLQGKCVFDIKASGVSKGLAIATLMGQPLFAGRVPLFAGDDTTDEAGFAAVQGLGGEGIKIGVGHSLAERRCTSPTELRQWLKTSLRDLQGNLS